MCVGDWIQKLIHILSFGTGKKIATKIANLLGFEDCGCSERQRKINQWFGCKKDIKLL
jgi:hypothetical protein